MPSLDERGSTSATAAAAADADESARDAHELPHFDITFDERRDAGRFFD